MEDPRKEMLNKSNKSYFYPTYLQLETDYASHRTIQKQDIENVLAIAIGSK